RTRQSERARILPDRFLARERALVHDIELQARHGVGVRVDDEDVPVRRDRQRARPRRLRGGSSDEREDDDAQRYDWILHDGVSPRAAGWTSPYSKQSRTAAARSASVAGASGSRSQMRSSRGSIWK